MSVRVLRLANGSRIYAGADGEYRGVDEPWDLGQLAIAHSRVEFSLLRLWLLRERAWGQAMADGIPHP